MRLELYRWVRGSSVWTFTSADTAVDYNLETYLPIVIGHGERSSRTEISKENLQINMDIDNDFARELLSYFGDEILVLTLFIQTSSGTDVGWKGRYVSQKPAGSKLNIVVESIFTALRRPGLRARYQKTCRHALYDDQCTIDEESFAVESVLESISGITIIVPEAALQSDGFYLGGMIRALTDNSLRWIVNHVGETLTLVRPFEALEEAIAGYGINYGGSYGAAFVKIYPGCDHIRTTCVNDFNNVLNFGGFPWIPSKNPMGGSSIV